MASAKRSKTNNNTVEYVPRKYILELNQTKATQVRKNGDYTVVLPNQIPLRNMVSTAVMKMASIDSQKNESSSIVIAEDTPVSLQLAYVDYDYDKTDKYVKDKTVSWSDPTYEPYAMYDARDVFKLDSVEFFVNAPLDSTVCVPTFSWITPSGAHRQSSTKPKSRFYYFGKRNTGTTKPEMILTCTPQNDPILYRDGTLTLTGVEAAIDGGKTLIPQKDIHFQQYNTSLVSTGDTHLHTDTVGFTLPAGKYDPEAIAKEITFNIQQTLVNPDLTAGSQLFQPSQELLLRIDDSKYQGAFFTQMPEDEVVGNLTFDNSNSYVYWDGSATPSYMIGARKFAIDYGLNGNIFQLSDCHTSVYNSADAGKDNVAVYPTGTLGLDRRYQVVTRATFCCITGLEPQSLWEDLGLYDKIITPMETDASGIQYIVRTAFEDKVPKESFSVAAFMPQNDRVIDESTLFAGGNPLYIDTTDTDTVPVLGDQASIISDGGFYKVRVQGLGPINTYVDGCGSVFDMAGVVSKQYQSDDVITGFEGDSGIMYQHFGADRLVNKFDVRIESGNTNQVPDNLGVNNSIFIELTTEVPTDNVMV